MTLDQVHIELIKLVNARLERHTHHINYLNRPGQLEEILLTGRRGVVINHQKQSSKLVNKNQQIQVSYLRNLNNFLFFFVVFTLCVKIRA